VHLTPSETARRFGVSIKALRLYESRGLLTPLRTHAGWRTYGPDQIARLHQILTLKRLGLPLARIAQLVADAGILDTVLALQEQTLTRDSQHLARALELVRAARAKLAAGQALSIDDLANLTKETVMTRPSYKDISQTLKPFRDQHFSPEEREALKAKVGQPMDREQLIKDLEGLTTEAQALMQTGDPTSPAAQDLARRWTDIARQITALGINTKAQAVWNDALNDPATAGKLALHREIFRFVEQAIAHWKTLPK
jgi:DNA-binding transcriptional MerR regulator